VGPAGAVIAVQTVLVLLWISGILGLALFLVLMAVSLLMGLVAFRSS
jgi:hypothetical protein